MSLINNQDWVNHISTGTHFVKEGGSPPKKGGPPQTGGNHDPEGGEQSARIPKCQKIPIGGGPRGGSKMAKNGQKRGQKGQIQLCRISSSHGNLRCISLPGTARFVGWSVGWGIVIVQNSPPSEKKIVLIPTSSNFKILLALY